MSAAVVSQRVGKANRPAGKVPDGNQLAGWLQTLPRAAYPLAAALVTGEVVEKPEGLERELVRAFLAHAPVGDQRPAAEALLLAVLGRDPQADAFGFAGALPLPADAPPAPVTILERAVQVGEHAWQQWPEARRRREYLLLEFFDVALTDPREAGRNDRLTACLQLLADAGK